MEFIINGCGWFLIVITVVAVFTQKSERMAETLIRGVSYSAFIVAGLRATGII